MFACRPHVVAGRIASASSIATTRISGRPANSPVGMDALHRVGCARSGPQPLVAAQDGGKHPGLGDTDIGIHRRRADGSAHLAVVQPDQADEAAAAEIGLRENVGDRRDAVVGRDDAGERPVGMVQRPGHVHVPLPHIGADGGRTDIQSRRPWHPAPTAP